VLKKIFPILPFVLLFPLLLLPAFLQFKIVSTFTPAQLVDEARYLPSGNFLKGAALCYDEILADFLWIKAIAYFGEHFDTDKDYTWLAHILDITTTLDPAYEEVYELGGIILANELNDIDSSLKILQKGMDNVPQHHPRYWYLPFFTAFNYMYFKHDYLTAARYLEQAASFPQRPAYLPLLVARLYANTDDPRMATLFLEEMLAQTDSPEMQASLQKRIKEVQVKQDIKILSTASEQFHKRIGRYPEHLEELLYRGILSVLPTEPFGGKYQIMKNGTIESTSNTDTMKLHIPKKEPSTAPLIFTQEPK
jgi:hypothetical protein